jgi:uncharacterized membrane protein YbhN (UPF0104 family)
VISALLLVLIVRRAGMQSTAGLLTVIQPWWVATGLLLAVAATASQATQWRVLLEAAGVRRAWWRCLRVVFIGSAFNTVMPSSIGGDAARALLIADAPAERAPAAAAVVLQRLCNLPGMAFILLVGLLLTAGDRGLGPLRSFALAAILSVALGLSVAMTPALAALGGWRGLAGTWLGRSVSRVLNEMNRFRTRRGVLLAASGRGALFWSLSVVNQWCYMRAVGLDLGLPHAALVVTLVNGLTMLPISINGYGLRESGFLALLGGTAAATASQALAVGLLVAGQTLVWGGLGLLCWLVPGRLPARPAPTPAVEVEAA